MDQRDRGHRERRRLIELYNPADIYQAFADAAREAAGLPSEPTAADDLLSASGIGPEEALAPRRTSVRRRGGRMGCRPAGRG